MTLRDVAAVFSPGQPGYITMYAAAIVFFCFFYTALVFNPKEIAENLNLFHERLKMLTEVTEQANQLKGDSKSQAIFCRDYVFAAMKDLREPADKLEMLVDENSWPFPTYGELLYNI